jgi:hypothetical protein
VHLTVPKDPRTTVAILWRTKDETTLATTVQFGEGSALDRTQQGITFDYATPGVPNVRIHETHLCGLEPDTEYSYRAGGVGADGAESWSPTYTFRTAPDRAQAPDAEVEVLLIGDTRDSYGTWGDALRGALGRSAPDFIFFSGDAVNFGTIQEQWDMWFGAAGEGPLARAPMVFAHGNHEINSPNFFAQFALPGDEQNYQVDLGAIHLTVANDSPTASAHLTGRNAMLLGEGVQAGMSAPWNLLMHHKPQWNAGNHRSDAMLIRSAWGAIVDGAKVDLVVNGHDHDYQRTKRLRGGVETADGTVHVVVGSAGAPLYNVSPEPFTEVVEKTNSYAILRVRRGMLKLDAFRLDGSALDSFTLTK